MAGNAEIFFEHDSWGRNLAWSAGLHVAVAGCISLYAMVWLAAAVWGTGGGGDAMGVTLVSTVPLPANPAPDAERPGERVEGVNAIATQARRERAGCDSDSGQECKDETQARISERQQKAKPEPEEANNVVPFGQGGPVSGPYGVFNAGGAKGGFGFTGGGGDFGSRYAWYVRGVQQKVSENWLKYEVDPSVTDAPQGLRDL